MRTLLFCVLLCFSYSSLAQHGIEDNDWYARYDSELYYGLSSFSISSFLKVEEGILIYSHQKGELLYLNNEHLIIKSWNIKVRHSLIEHPVLYFYDDNTVVLSSFVDRKSYWLKLKSKYRWKETDKLNPGTKYLQSDLFRYKSYLGHKIVMNQNNGHPETLASLYAYKGFKKQKLYSIDIPEAGVANNGNIIDSEIHTGFLWTLDVVKKELNLFDSSLNVSISKDISYLWDNSYLRKIRKQGLAIIIDCQLLYDRKADKLYLFKQSYDRSQEGISRLTQLFQVKLDQQEINFKLVVEKPAYISIDQVFNNIIYFTSGGEEILNPNPDEFDFDGKTDFVYQIELAEKELK